MKQASLFILLIFFLFDSQAQRISGVVMNAEKESLPAATITVEGTYLGTMSDANGKFEFKNLKAGEYDLRINYVGYESVRRRIKLDDKDIDLSIILPKLEILTDEVTVRAYRADNQTPVAYSDMNGEDIENTNSGKDIPYILELTPSVVASSDAGAGVGYTQLRIRGTDMTRINVTLDGIPLNDPESHGVWWVDLPDYASSVDNIQIQRGAGSSTNGAAAFGANINFKTNTLNKDSYTEISSSYGSFNTLKSTAKIGTGLLNKHFTFDARASKIHSGGYIDRAYTDMESAYLSGAYTDKKNLLRINIFSGVEETYQAWGGVPKSYLDTNRTYNPYTYDNEIDHYLQQHAQLFYTREITSNLSANLAFHYTKGSGYYEQYKDKEDLADYNMPYIVLNDTTLTQSDIIRRKWLENDFYGFIYTLNYHNNKLKLVVGGGYNEYDGEHFGRVIWAQYAGDSEIRHEWYRNNGFKTDLNSYLKLNYALTERLNLWADLQYRLINYDITGINDDRRDISQTHDYDFFNPKGGLSFDFRNGHRAYASFAVANREPARTDLVEASPDNYPQHETLYDYEAGYQINAQKFTFNYNLYLMYYKNQLIFTGEINDVGSYISENIPESYRAGIELSAAVKPVKQLTWAVNATFSQNKIKDYTTYIDDWDTWTQVSETYEDTDISFSPNIIAASDLTYNIITNLDINFASKYVGKQYIDNSSNDERALDAYFVNNLRLSYKLFPKKLNEIRFNFSINNIFDEQYESNAWVYRYQYKGEKDALFGYYPQAGIHFTGGVSLKF